MVERCTAFVELTLPFLSGRGLQLSYLLMQSTQNTTLTYKAKTMLNADLTVTSNAGSITLPGDTGATVFSQINNNASPLLQRRVAATAGTTPETLSIGHTLSGSGFSQRLRSLVRLDNRFINTDVADTGGVTPSFSFYSVLDRPIQSGGVITDAIVTRQIARVLHVILASGQLAKLLNQEA